MKPSQQIQKHEDHDLHDYYRGLLLTAIEGFLVSYEEYRSADQSLMEELRREDAPIVATSNPFKEQWDRKIALVQIRTFRMWFMLNAANQILRYRNLAIKKQIIEPEIFAELKEYEADIKLLRDMNEHADEYFQGYGKRPKDWHYTADGCVADPTSTVSGKIGNRLDPRQLRAVVQRIKEELTSSSTWLDSLIERERRYAEERGQD